jgi:hypothetical protein
MKRTSLVPESVLASRELAEVLGRLGDGVVEQLEDNATGRVAADDKV